MTFDTNIILAEIFGTAMLILLGDGVVAAVLLAKSKAQNSGWIVITFAWAMAVFAGVVVAGPISGAHLNPAVTLGLVVQNMMDSAVGLPAGDAPQYFVGEFIGAFIGATLVLVHYWDHFKATEDQGLKLAVFCTAPNIRNYPMNFVAEVIGTFVLVFVIFCFGNWAGPTAGGLAALGAFPVAFLVLVIGLSLGGNTGYAINPARDLGPRIIHFIMPVPGKGSSDWEYSWVPVVGPLVGGALAAIVYQGVFASILPA